MEQKFLVFFLFKISIFFSFLSNMTFDPSKLKRSTIVFISFTTGMFLIIIFLFDKIVDASIGSAEFFEPETFIEPDIFLPPIISNFSIKNYTLGKVTPV